MIPAFASAAAGLALALTLCALPARALTLLNTAHDGQSGTGLDITSATDLHVVLPAASFSGNGFNGLFDNSASLLVLGGRFADNGNAGLQVITDSTRSVVVAGGAFTGNLAGMDVYGAKVTVLRGDFSGNSAYGFEAHSDGRVNGGNFGGNGDFGIIAFGGTTSVHGGSFGGNGWGDFAASGGGVLQLYGVFDRYGALTGNGSFSGALADGVDARTFSYTVFAGGSIVLNPLAATVSAVPEPAGALLLAAGLVALRLRGRQRAVRIQ